MSSLVTILHRWSFTHAVIYIRHKLYRYLHLKYESLSKFLICRPRKSTELCKTRLTYNPAEHKHGLLPPPYYCGKWVRQRRIHFQLPHDLWWLHTNNQLPGRDIVPSWNYKKIRTSESLILLIAVIFPFVCN